MLEKIQIMTLMFIDYLKAKRDERGATAVEYGLMVALIAAVHHRSVRCSARRSTPSSVGRRRDAMTQTSLGAGVAHCATPAPMHFPAQPG